MCLGHRPAAGRRRQDRDAEPFAEVADRAAGAGEDRAAAGDQDRPLCGGDEVHGGRQRGRIGGRARSRHRPRIGRDLPDAETDVAGKLDVDRTRLTAGGDLDGAPHRPGDVFRQLDRRGPLGDRGEHGDVVRLLKRAFAIGLAGRAHPEHQHRRTARVRLQDAGHQIRDTRSGTPEAGGDLIGHPGVGHSHEGAGGFEADPDRPRPTVRFESDERVVQVARVTRETKDVRHALRLHGEDDGFPPGQGWHGYSSGPKREQRPSVINRELPYFLTPGKFGKFGARLASRLRAPRRPHQRRVWQQRRGGFRLTGSGA